MADNVELNAGSGGATLATDQDVALAHHQLVKIEFGADGTQTPVSAANPLPITGSLTDTELRATAVPVSGTVTASGPLTDTELRATAVPVSGTVTASGPLTDTELRATAVPVSGTVTATVTGVATAAKQLPDGHNVVATGTVTANAGTDLNTSALALDATLTDATQKTQQVGATGVVNSVFT
ncbi:hypothetical protein KKF61_08150, partial [Patescibacteria group bacterium]|nr:hypothetical protein [Patescibacteria group bacterium]